MIYLADDYVTKYSDTLSYLIERSVYEKYAYAYIERSIAYSRMISDLENSNVILIAFSSQQENYHSIFPLKDEDGFVNDVYSMYGWAGNIYMHLFLDLEITFESLFMVVPLEEMFKLYHLYHEMDYRQVLDEVRRRVPFTILDVIMKRRRMSSSFLAGVTNIPLSTIKALRYKKRDIERLEASKLLSIASALDVKMPSLLPSIHLRKEDLSRSLL